MNIRGVSSQFTVYVHWTDIDHGTAVKVALAQAGYDVYFFDNADLLRSRIQQSAPHLLIFPTAALSGPLSDFIESFLSINSDIRFLTVARPSQTKTLAAYNEYGLQEVITDDLDGLVERCVFGVDRACERLYLTYQNEQLAELWQQEKAKHSQTSQVAENSAQAARRVGPPLEERIKDYRSASSKEDLLRRFMQIAGNTPCVYFKYLPTVKSLVVTNSSTFDLDRLQGVGCQLQSEEAKDFGTQVTLGIVPPTFASVLQASFGFHQARLLPLFAGDNLEGVVAYSAALPADEKMRLDDEFALLSLSYSHLALEKKADMLEVQDPATGAGNRRFHEKHLAEEYSRSRRIRQPLSMVKLGLDDYFELGQTLGDSAAETLLRNLAQLIIKTSRTNDTTSRTGTNEFSLILPHCDRNGAMVRAERLRRLVESSQMMDNGLKISISLGISEYPTLCSAAEELDATAGKSLSFIQGKGGNRLCLYKADDGHKPDFEFTPSPVDKV